MMIEISVWWISFRLMLKWPLDTKENCMSEVIDPNKIFFYCYDITACVLLDSITIWPQLFA
jgi:hypothetical protein